MWKHEVVGQAVGVATDPWTRLAVFFGVGHVDPENLKWDEHLNLSLAMAVWN
jgi:hypothetical protein